jgi:hypothetical protein
MAKINMIARDTKRKRLVDLHAAKRAELKKAEGNFFSLVWLGYKK